MNEWKQRIHDLEALGWTLTSIARRVGRSVSAISDIKQGRTAEPGGMAAIALLNLHRKESKRKAA